MFKLITFILNFYWFMSCFILAGLVNQASTNLLLIMLCMVDAKWAVLLPVLTFTGQDPVAGAQHWSSTNELRFYLQLGLPVLGAILIWALSSKTRNRLMHSLNGNIIYSVLSLFWSLLVLAVPGVLKVQHILVGTSMLFFINVIYEQVLGMPNYLGPQVTNIYYWAVLRGAGYLLKVAVRKGLNWLTFNRVHLFVEMIARSVDLSAYIFLWFVFVTCWTYLFYLFTFASYVTFVLVFIIVTPLLVLMTCTLVYSSLDLFFHIFFGFPLGAMPMPGYLGLLGRLIRTFYHNIIALVKGIEGFKNFILRVLSGLIFGTIQLSHLPLEIVELIYWQDSHHNVTKLRYFWWRVLLGVLFCYAYMFMSFFYISSFFAFTFLEIVVFLFFASLKYPDLGFIASLNYFLSLFFYSIGLIDKPYFTNFYISVKRLFCLVYLRSAAYSNSLPYIIVSDVEGRPVRVNSKTKFEDLDPLIVDVITVRLLKRNLIVLVPIFAILVATMAYKVFLLAKDRVIRPLFKIPLFIMNLLCVFLLAFLIPDHFIDIFSYSLFLIYDSVSFMLPEVKAFFRMTGLSLMWGVLWFDQANQEAPAGGADYAALTNLSSVFVRSWVSLTRRSILRFTEYLDKMALPEMIQAAYRPPSLDSIRSTYAFLHEIGFPVDQGFISSLDRPESSSYLAEWGSWKNWLLGTSNFSLGFGKVKVGVRNFLPKDFYPDIAGYKYTTGFTGIIEEITSTARYWTGNDKIEMNAEDFEALVDDTWHAVKVQYAGSRLSSFDYVYRNWIKKYNMGFGFGVRNAAGRLRQLSRQAVIDRMGGKPAFMKAWKDIFKNAQNLVMPSPVFTKWESLKLKKSISRSVRTVVGSAFSHHVMTTVFNYKPNHNYHPWENPSKVGMPINGQNFDKLWRSIAGHAKVWAGDMTAFDSSQPPPLLMVAREIRKRGYDLHKDYHKICQLIDISYDMLRDQPLGFKNFGDIATKGQGATTGHSSTTPDNTIMLVANYLFAWRAITGLRAREFFNFNTLANFGDDHVLGYDPVFGWSPEAAIDVMKKIGTVMRDESPGQSWLPIPGAPLPDGVKDWRDAKFSFLSKMPLPMDATIRSELLAAGVTVDLAFATCHDRSRLLGKIKGETTDRKLTPKPRYEALLGFMELCAHHKDIYDELRKQSINAYQAAVFENKKSGGTGKGIRQPPSYNQIVQNWYAKGVKDADFNPADEQDEDSIIVYTSPDPFGLFIRWVSDFPTILSPRYRNTRWADWIQNKLVLNLRWPLEYIAQANAITNDHAATRFLAARTPYAFLRSDLLVPGAEQPTFGVLSTRHYLFMLYSRLVNYRRSFSILDFLRLFDSLWINLIFILTGRVTQSVVELELHVLDTLVIYLLSYVNIDIPLFAIPFYLPTPTDLGAQLISYLFAKLTPSGSIDFQSLHERLRRLHTDPGQSFVLDAPTGTGKSTRMVNSMSELLPSTLIVVIVPRQLVAVSVGLYMRQLYPNTGIFIAAEGHKIGDNPRIVYSTVQSFFLNPILRDPNNLFVLDEAHIVEPHYNVMRNFLFNEQLRKIYMTATPGNLYPDVFLLRVPAVSQHRILEGDSEVPSMNDYLKACAAFANDRSSMEKVLIFVPTIKQMERLRHQIRHTCSLISSKHKHPDLGSTVFISTSVSDAGTTIPDVSFVITSDVDVTVTTLDEGPVSYYYRVSPLTMRQRRGRTGRTNSGAVLRYKITDIELSPLSFSVADYLSALSPAVEYAFQSFPKEIVDKMTVPQKNGLAYWDQNVLKPNWVEYLKALDETASEIGFTKKALTEFFKGALGSAKGPMNWSGPFDDDKGPIEDYHGKPSAPIEDVEYVGTEVMADGTTIEVGVTPQGDVVLLGEDGVLAKVSDHQGPLGKVEPTVVRPVTPPVPVVNVPVAPVAAPVRPVRPHPRTHKRHNVSGRGLQCGVRAAIGIIYTWRGVRRSEDLIRTQLFDMQDAAALEAQEVDNADGYHNVGATMFQATSIQELLFVNYNIVTHLMIGGQRWNLPTEMRGLDRNAFPPAILFLDAAHFNYAGVPYEDALISDEAPFVWP